MNSKQAECGFGVAAEAGGGNGWRRVVAGWCFVLLYLGSYSPAGLAATALAASFDPNHSPFVVSNEYGMQLVLHHGLNCRGHRHGAVARAVTFFAQPLNAGNPDHIIQFTARNVVRTKACTAPASPIKPAHPFFALLQIPPFAPTRAIPPASVSRRALNDGNRLIGLRSTVLLI